ncbi:MAG: sigma-70 family RNA polymerase sigma factor [Planctomycetota bacterium]
MRDDEQARRDVGLRLECVERFLAARNRRLQRPLGRDQIDDLAQDVKVEVWKNLSRFAGRARLETWVYRFCHLALLRRISRGRERDQRVREAQDRYAQSRDEAAAERAPLDDSAESDELARLLRHLTPREALVTRRRHVEQLEFSEIAAELGLSTSSTKTYYYRSVEKLRSVLRTGPEPQR